MGGAPVGPDTDVDHQGDVQGDDVLHPAAHELRDGVDVLRRHLEDELVVHLEDHLGGEAGVGEAVHHLEHRLLDQIGLGALDHRVDRHALGRLALDPVAR